MPDFPDPGFMEFIAHGCDRRAYLMGALAARGAQAEALDIGNSRHVRARFGKRQGGGQGRELCFIAHYDRAPQGQGANDNSAACYQLLALAGRLAASKPRRPVDIVFTDSEELFGAAGIREQGAYGLAQHIKAGSQGRPAFFIADMTGRGDTLVISSSGQDLLARRKEGLEPFKRSLDELHARAARALLAPARGRLLALPTPFSDNLGLILSGFDAVTLTVLPRREAFEYGIRVGTDPALAQAVSAGPSGGAMGRLVKEAFPPTWRAMHSEADSADALESEAFELMAACLDALCSLDLEGKTSAP
jgi:hypothetical protein